MQGLKRALLAAALCLAVAAAQAKSKNEGANEADVSKALQASAAAWSRGDLAGFMQCYENSPNTAYLKNTGLVQGFEAISGMYANRYGTGHAMGRLSLELMNYRQLGAAYALVTGRFALARPKADGGDASGVFSLVFHRSASGWHIIYDHSS